MGAQEQNAESKQLHELLDIHTEEVSVVDRAANKRRFIVVKSSDGSVSMGAELQAKDDGTFEVTKDADGAEDTTETKKDDESTTPADGADTKSEKADDQVDDTTETKKDDEPGDADITDAAKRIADELAKAEESGDLTGLTDQFGDIAKLVEKAGARMAQGRLRRFKEAVNALVSVLSELSPEPAAGAKTSEAKGRKSTTKAEVEDHSETIAKLTGQVTELTKMVGKLAEARGTGNAQTVEKSSKAAPREVSWPRDMARPITRDTVAKERGFFD